MRFDWDEAKNRRNVAKHGIHFETAVLVFEDPYALVRLDRVIDGEERWQTIGMINGLVVLLVAHTGRRFDSYHFSPEGDAARKKIV